MPVVIDPWLTGPGITAVTVKLKVADAAGAFTDGVLAIQTLTGVIDDISPRGVNTLQNITPLTSAFENEVAVERADTFSLTEIMRAAPTLNLLRNVWDSAEAGGDYALVTFTAGGNTVTYTGLFSNYRETGQKGKNTAMMDLLLIDTLDSGTGASIENPAYA